MSRSTKELIMDLKALIAALKVKQAALGTLQTAVDAAQAVSVAAPEDAAKKAAFESAQKSWEAASNELTVLSQNLEKSVEQAKTEAAVAKSIADAEALAATVIPGAIAATKTAAEAKPEVDGDYEKLFCSFVTCKSVGELGGVALEALRPKTASLKEKAAQYGDQMAARIPERWWGRMVGKTAVLSAEESAILRLFAKKAIPMLSSDATEDGGRANLFWPKYDNILHALPPVNPSLYERVSKFTIPGNELREPILVTADGMADEYGGVQVSRGTEGADANETEINFDQRVFKTSVFDAYSEISNRILRLDQVGLESALVSRFTPALIRQANYEIMHGLGEGSSQAVGIRQSADVTVVERTTAAQVVRQDLINLKFSQRPMIRQGASFCLSDSVEKFLTEQEISATTPSTDRRPLFSSSVRDGVTDQLEGKAWFSGTDMSALGSLGDVIFGNWLMYWWVWSQEAVLSRSMHYQFKKGLMAYRVDAEAGGKPLFPEAFSVLGLIGS